VTPNRNLPHARADVLAEAEAARAAGWQAVLVSRPGNKEVAAGHAFPVVHSMQELL